MARVFLTRRSRGVCFLLAKASFSALRWFWLITVSTRATDFLTTLLRHEWGWVGGQRPGMT